MLTLDNSASKYVDIMEKTRNKHQQAINETARLLLKGIIEPLLQNEGFELFRPLILRVGLILRDGHLSNVRVVEVMLLARSYVSAKFIDDQIWTTITQHSNIIGHKICIQNMSTQSHRWETSIFQDHHLLGVVSATSLPSIISNWYLQHLREHSNLTSLPQIQLDTPSTLRQSSRLNTVIRLRRQIQASPQAHPILSLHE